MGSWRLGNGTCPTGYARQYLVENELVLFIIENEGVMGCDVIGPTSDLRKDVCDCPVLLLPNALVHNHELMRF